jgi:outer membrane protein OmpA-like peptidoglycan-associated protein
MKHLVVLTALLALLMVGCGVNKDYVQEQISQSEANTNAKINDLQQKTQTNSEDIAKLQSLAQQLQEDTKMALNQAAGFENYQIIWEGEINFAFDVYKVSDVAAQTLDEAGAKMEANPRSVMELVGHTDRTGSDQYNLMLGQQRAMAAQRYLANNFGISLYRMFIMSEGKQKPVAMPDESNAASRNRRVHMVLWGPMTGQ